ncbi:MAG: type II secretion system minor pseudopilin GspJ [Gammaproteobacteria bacterium]
MKHYPDSVAAARGFTLVELLVAMAIFSIMSLMAYQGMQAVFASREQTDAESRRLQTVQMAFLMLQRDLMFISPREIRDEYGDVQAAFQLDENSLYPLELSRDGYRNPARLPRSSLQRVAYAMVDNTLYRIRWPVLDRAPDTQSLRRTLLEDVEDFSIRALDDDGEWHPVWPVANGGRPLPRAVEVSLTLKDWGQLTRLFMLPEVD